MRKSSIAGRRRSRSIAHKCSIISRTRFKRGTLSAKRARINTLPRGTVRIGGVKVRYALMHAAMLSRTHDLAAELDNLRLRLNEINDELTAMPEPLTDRARLLIRVAAQTVQDMIAVVRFRLHFAFI